MFTQQVYSRIKQIKPIGNGTGSHIYRVIFLLLYPSNFMIDCRFYMENLREFISSANKALNIIQLNTKRIDFGMKLNALNVTCEKIG